MNPFQSTSRLNPPLSVEVCQAMIVSAANTMSCFSIRSDEDMLGLRDLAAVYGREVYILAPPMIEQLFQGVTLAVYQEVERLYCSSVFRSHHTVWRILSNLAAEAQVAPPTREAIWAICGYLNAVRDERIGPWVAQSDAQWQITDAHSDVTVISGTTQTRPELTCIIDVQIGHIIAFHRHRVGESREQAHAAALYMALCTQRQQAQRTPGGLVWTPPRQVRVDAALPQQVAVCFAELGVSILGTAAPHAIIDDVQGTWTRSLSGRILSAERFDLMLDTYLRKRYGYGPQTAAADADYAFRNLDGYNRDPAFMLPPLRWLLPACNVTVEERAAVTVDGRCYQDDLLRYWSGAPVTVRVSRHDPRLAYIYLDGEILCVASQAV